MRKYYMNSTKRKQEEWDWIQFISPEGDQFSITEKEFLKHPFVRNLLQQKEAETEKRTSIEIYNELAKANTKIHGGGNGKRILNLIQVWILNKYKIKLNQNK